MNFTLEVKKYLISLQVTNSTVKILFFYFRVTNSRLKNKKNPLRVTNTMGELLCSHFRVKNVKFEIYEKNPFKYYSLNVRETL